MMVVAYFHRVPKLRFQCGIAYDVRLQLGERYQRTFRKISSSGTSHPHPLAPSGKSHPQEHLTLRDIAPTGISAGRFKVTHITQELTEAYEAAEKLLEEGEVCSAAGEAPDP